MLNTALTSLCTAGKRCGHEDCDKAAQGSAGLCTAHSGGAGATRKESKDQYTQKFKTVVDSFNHAQQNGKFTQLEGQLGRHFSQDYPGMHTMMSLRCQQWSNNNYLNLLPLSILHDLSTCMVVLFELGGQII